MKFVWRKWQIQKIILVKFKVNGKKLEFKHLEAKKHTLNGNKMNGKDKLFMVLMMKLIGVKEILLLI